MSTQAPFEVGDRVGDATVLEVDETMDNAAALLSDGRVVCWGANDYGQCDVPPDLGPAVQVKVSPSHTVALLADGRVVCWGDNDEDECDVPPDLGPAVQIMAGDDSWSDPEMFHRFTAVLLADGRMRIWGGGLCGVEELPWELVGGEAAMELILSSGSSMTNYLGQELADVIPQGSVKQRFGQENDYYQGHGGLLLSDGRLVFWGCNREGECDVPSSIEGRVSQVHAGFHSTWVVDVDGRLHAWGWIKEGLRYHDESECCSLPFELGDEAWLEFATRMWGKTREEIFPSHIRESAAFKAISAMHKLSQE